MDLILFTTLVIVILAIVLAANAVRRDSHPNTSWVKRIHLAFGIMLLLGVVGSIPLYLMTGLNLANIVPANWIDPIVQWIFFGYPLLYIISIFAAQFQLRRERRTSAIWWALLPGVNLLLLGLIWIAILLYN